MIEKKHLKDHVCLNSSFLMWIHQSKKNKKSFFHDIDEFNVHLEYIRNRTTFRCHPNYNSNGEWYDWVMVWFEIAGSKASHGKKKLGMWNGHYFPSKILCFFVLPDDETTYAIIQSTSSSNHENDSILFERWELEESLCYQKNGKKYIYPNLHIVDVDSFGDPILAVMDDSNIEHDHNNDSAMVTVVIPFAKSWPKKFMSAYRR